MGRRGDAAGAPRAILTRDDIARVLVLRRDGTAPARIARLTGLSRESVREALDGWKLGPDDAPVEAGTHLPEAGDTRGLITLRDAAMMLGLDKSAVRRMIGSRLLVPVARTSDGRSLVRRADVVALGAQARGSGERSASARLSASDRASVREAMAAGESSTELAQRYGVSRRHVYRIAEAEPWSDASTPAMPALAAPEAAVPPPSRRGPRRHYDHEEAVRLVLDDGFTMAEVARRFGVSPTAIRLAVLAASEVARDA